MKHLLFILSLLITVSLYAQNQKGTNENISEYIKYADKSDYTFEEITFEGVTLKDKTLYQFISLMEQKGFVKEDLISNIASMRGNFLNEPARLIILSTKEDKLVCRVSVLIDPPTASWESLKENYFRIKKVFTEKYGEPFMSSECFNDSLYTKEGRQITGVKKEKCNYRTYFPSIVVEISELCKVRILYADPDNTAILAREKREAF